MDNSETFRILTVCTGNICRSPVAERLLQKGLDDLHPGKFLVSSAGTSALVGRAMQPLSAEIVQAHGGNSEGFAARQLNPALIREADLILALTTEHRTQILHMAPAAMKRTFTIRELGRMLTYLGTSSPPSTSPIQAAESWRTLATSAASVRHLTVAHGPLDNDVVDPYRQDASVYKEMELQLLPALGVISSFAGISSTKPANS